MIGQVTKDTPRGQVTLRGPVDAIAYTMNAVTAHEDLLSALRYIASRRQNYGTSNDISPDDTLRELHRIVNDIQATARATIASAELQP